MRYLIHLLPSEDECNYLADLRNRVKERIGNNKAQDYPTPHVTLVYDIEDETGNPGAIDRQRLEKVVDVSSGARRLDLTLGQLTIWGLGDHSHVVYPIVDSVELRSLREDLWSRVKTVVAGPDGRYAARAAKVQAESHPHLTIAQDVTRAAADTARAMIGAEDRPLTSLRGVEVVLLEKSNDADYSIVHRVGLHP